MLLDFTLVQQLNIHSVSWPFTELVLLLLKFICLLTCLVALLNVIVFLIFFCPQQPGPTTRPVLDSSMETVRHMMVGTARSPSRRTTTGPTSSVNGTCC